MTLTSSDLCLFHQAAHYLNVQLRINPLHVTQTTLEQYYPEKKHWTQGQLFNFLINQFIYYCFCRCFENKDL